MPAGTLSLASLAQSSPLVVFFYSGKDDGRRNADTLRVLRWFQHRPDLVSRGYRIVAVSARPVGEQSRHVQGILAAREEPGYDFLSDGDLRLARALGLPTVEVAGARAYGRLTLVVREGRIGRVWFPVDPVRDAATVSDWTRRADA